jgi:hypothetical protein
MRASLIAFFQDALKKAKLLSARAQQWTSMTTRKVVTKFVATVNRLPHDFVDPQAPKPMATNAPTARYEIFKHGTSEFSVNIMTSVFLNTSGSTYHLYGSSKYADMPEEGDLTGLVGHIIKIALRENRHGLTYLGVESHRIGVHFVGVVEQSDAVDLIIRAGEQAGIRVLGPVKEPVSMLREPLVLSPEEIRQIGDDFKKSTVEHFPGGTRHKGAIIHDEQRMPVKEYDVNDIRYGTGR